MGCTNVTTFMHACSARGWSWRNPRHMSSRASTGYSQSGQPLIAEDAASSKVRRMNALPKSAGISSLVQTMWTRSNVKGGEGQTSLTWDYSFLDVYDPDVGSYIPIFTDALLDLVNHLSTQHRGMKRDVWNAGYRDLSPRVKKLRQSAETVVIQSASGAPARFEMPPSRP